MTNWELLRWADYSNPKRIKALLMRMNNLLLLAEKGDTVAHSIYIDLKNALYTKGVLSDKQRKYLLLWMAGWEQGQIAWASDVWTRSVERTLGVAIKNIILFLGE